MPPPSELARATKAVERLVKEESFYRAELAKQQDRVRQLAAEIENATDPSTLDTNAEYVLKQESRAVLETKAVFRPLQQHTSELTADLQELIARYEREAAPTATQTDELEKARAVARTGQTAIAKDLTDMDPTE
ncbi:tubulin-specific chaperone [Ophiostoma piceae UAMH 11346]|uniref:Tubulin-specific chaperone A n=1 Tax=Ophiostoma piceae (strain UAMH 11346) TaxID=1262450 RepID=S3D0P4_OPHP1|nr:tubulin-specific chaperone [Ophiostoma piceae UAMH 11346]